MLLQAFYSIRSERQLMERLEYDLLFRWFVQGIGVDAAVSEHSVFSKNRDRLLEGNIAARFLAAVLDQPRVKKLLSTEHFTVDGTLIEAWASLKSFSRDGSDFRRPVAGAIPKPISTARSGRTRRMSRRPGSRCTALPQGAGQGSQALLHRPWLDGEPPWPSG